MSKPSPPRPAVALIVPFFGSPGEAASLFEHLGRLRLRRGDEVIVADNTPGRVPREPLEAGAVRAIACTVTGSAYAARNEGAESTTAPWLLFADADCRLPEDLLDAYFEEPPGERSGAVAGQVLGVPEQPGVVPRYIRSRRHLDQELLREHPFRPMAVTANLLVRREAWAEIGGFAEMTRSGADAEFCWRLQDAGWELGYSGRALVHHEHRDDLRALLAQTRRDGAGAPWLARRYPGYPARLPAGAFARAAAGAVGWPLRGQPQRGLFKAIDGLWSAAFNLGSLEDNAPPAHGSPAAHTLVVALDEFPARDDPRLDALAEARAGGVTVRVEARERPGRAAWRAARGVPASIWEDDGVLSRLSTRGRSSDLVAPARRLRGAAGGATVLVEARLRSEVDEIARRAGRPDLRIETLPGEGDAAAERLLAAGERPGSHDQPA